MKRTIIAAIVIAATSMISFSSIAATVTERAIAGSTHTTGLLAGKVVLFSGGTGVAGKNMAYELAKSGANVVFVTHNPDTAKVIVDDMKHKFGVDGWYVAGPGNDPKAVKLFIKQIIGKYGKIDMVINNAGFGLDNPAYPLRPISETTEKDFDRIINSPGSLKDSYITTSLALAQMQKQGYGVVINTALNGFKNGVAKGSLYYAHKAAVEAFTKVAALENQNSKIRINFIYSNDPTVDSDNGNAVTQTKVGDVIAWLGSDAASDVTGASIDVN